MNRKTIVWLLKQTHPTRNEYSSAVIWWYGILENMGYNVEYYDYSDYNFNNFKQFVIDHSASIVIHPTYDQIHSEFSELQSCCSVYVLQSDDRWRYDNFGKFWIPYVDGVITYEGEQEKYIADGLPEEKFNKMKWSFNPNTMTLPIDSYKKKLLVSHVGGLHGNRRQLLNEFHSKGMKVHTVNNVLYNEVLSTWSQSKFSLNFTMNSTMQTRELKGRIVEIPNFKCALVTERFPDIEQYYDIDKEIIVFDTVEEGIEKIQYYNAHEDEWLQLAKNGYMKLWNSLTAYHEWDRILPNIDSDYVRQDISQLIQSRHFGEYYGKDLFKI